MSIDPSFQLSFKIFYKKSSLILTYLFYNLAGFILLFLLNSPELCCQDDSITVSVENKKINFIPLPDSLGGDLALGDVILRIYHSHNIPSGYDVLRIRIISNTCSAVQYYGIGAPNIKEAEKRGTIRGTKVLNRYRQRIDDSYNKIINSIDSTSRNFTNVDEESFNYTIEVNPRLQKSIDSAVSDYTVPKCRLPDSLGGTKMKGYFGVRVLINSEGIIKCWFPEAIILYNSFYNKNTTYVEGPPETVIEDSLIKQFSPWINKCLSQIKFTINSRHWLFSRFREIPLKIYIQVNAKKERNKGDLNFLLNYRID